MNTQHSEEATEGKQSPAKEENKEKVGPPGTNKKELGGRGLRERNFWGLWITQKRGGSGGKTVCWGSRCKKGGKRNSVGKERVGRTARTLEIGVGVKPSSHFE